MRLMLIVAAALAGVSLFLLATASGNTSRLAEQYPLLLVLNAGIAVFFVALVVYQLAALLRQYRSGVFGSRLTLRLLVLFASMAVVPGLLVYTISVQFLSRSIESWFDVKVDAALEGGINLGQSVIDRMRADLGEKARSVALELTDRAPGQPGLLLDRLREQVGAQEAVLVSASGGVIASASAALASLVPDLPSMQELRQARANRGLTVVDAPSGRPVAVRAIVPLGARAIGEEPRYLQLRASVPGSVAASAEAVEAAYRDYRELALSRQGLKRIYIVTLTLALLMALLVAVALAVILSDRLAAPLANLAQATRAVARGDFSRRAPVTSGDELGVLTASFNSMTGQLDEARAVVESAKARLESILANLSTGVLVFDGALRLTIYNHGAAAILGEELAASVGQPPQAQQAVLKPIVEPMYELAAGPEPGTWQREITLKANGKTLLARGTPLPQVSGGGHVLVFDDVTQLIQAQRATAWAEVARRLAHEIKNPLTPIQLSAERLEMKLSGKLSSEDDETLRRSTRTIVSQVSALKSMVDDFRDYARLPAPQPAPLDLNALVREVLALYEGSVPVRPRLGDGLPEVLADSAQVRQVLHNLLRNAQDALDNRKNGAAAEPFVEVRTECRGERVRLTVGDNGGGFPEEMMARIFEPYVTSKPRGTGLGLAIVKKIVDEHRGSIEIENRPGEGASVSISLPLALAPVANA
jgi:nitrogen fixation/metabolism regulation signal transduction histidine kinase